MRRGLQLQEWLFYYLNIKLSTLNWVKSVASDTKKKNKKDGCNNILRITIYLTEVTEKRECYSGSVS